MDCFEGMKQIDDNSIDLVLTDPPYSVKLKQSINLKGRKALYDDFKTMDWDNLDISDMYDLIFPHLDRVVKENGSVLMFCRVEYITYLIDSAKKNNFDVKATIIWHKTNPVPQIRKRNYLSSIEAIVWLARWKEDKCLFKFNFTTQKHMHNYVDMPICQGDRIHPTQKPIKLIMWLLERHSDENDVVLDPFIGSGTTAIACKKLHRKFIGFEINKDYVDFANEKLERTGIQYKKSGDFK